MNVKVQNQSIIRPRPPRLRVVPTLAKGGWGDLTFELDLNFELRHLAGKCPVPFLAG